MNIAMLSYHTCPLATLGGKDTGGMNVYVQQLSRQLGVMGIHVDVFTRSQDEHVPHIIHSLGYGNRVVHIPAGPENPLPKPELITYMPQFVDGVKHFAAEKGIHYDLIHSHYWMSGMAALALKQEWNVPILQMFHTLGLMKNRIAQSLSEIETGARIDGEMRLLQEVDCVVAATQAELSQMTFLYKITPKRHIILPPGVDLARFYPIPEDEAKEAIGIPTDNCLFLFVGRIEPLKGLPTLLKAVAILKEKGILSCCRYRLAIVGGDPSATLGEISAEMARLQNLSHELGLDELVIFLGKRDQEALPYYYSAAEVVIVPSHYESFGMVALEAMACGTPVVASQVGGLAFLVQDGVTGYVVPDNQPELLAEKLAHLISQPEVRQEMGSKAAAIARNYSWQNIAEQISVVYQQLVG